MNTVLDRELCRITVVGPDRRVDLAVPSTTPVASLLPLLLEHASAGAPADDDAAAGWALQRLGQQPFDLAGTPESLDWLEGEVLYLRRAEDPLPEMDFDDVAEGIATVVNRRPDRWRPEYRRPFFVVLSVAAMGLVAAVLTGRGPALAQTITAGTLGAAFLAAAIIHARAVGAEVFPLLFAGGAAAFAAVAASSAVDGDPTGIALTGPSLLAAATAVAAVATALLVAQRTVVPRLPFRPILVAGVTALLTAVLLLGRSGFGTTATRACAVAVAVLFVLIVVAPRAAVKVARLRGPQLPKTGADMSYDIEPAGADVVRARTDDADTYLTVAAVASALLLPVLFHHTLQARGWSGWTLVLVTSCAILLRARTFLGLWQRTALTAAGSVGVLMVIVRLSGMLSTGWWWVLFSGLLALVVSLVMAAMRPWPRRMLPFWEYSATFFDVATGIAVLPVLAQVLGLYGWARGLFG